MVLQGLLSRFSEENNRLAKENDKLRTFRQVLGVEHADVLDEIEQLRSKLSGLESAVISGTQTPSSVKVGMSPVYPYTLLPPHVTQSIQCYLLESCLSIRRRQTNRNTPRMSLGLELYESMGGLS